MADNDILADDISKVVLTPVKKKKGAKGGRSSAKACNTKKLLSAKIHQSMSDRASTASSCRPFLIV